MNGTARWIPGTANSHIPDRRVDAESAKNAGPVWASEAVHRQLEQALGKCMRDAGDVWHTCTLAQRRVAAHEVTCVRRPLLRRVHATVAEKRTHSADTLRCACLSPSSSACSSLAQTTLPCTRSASSSSTSRRQATRIQSLTSRQVVFFHSPNDNYSAHTTTASILHNDSSSSFPMPLT